MTQTVPAALVAPTKPGLTVGYLIRALNGTIATAFTTTNVAEQGTATGYYRVTDGVAAPDAGGILEWYGNNAGNAGAFLSAAAIEAMPDNFTAMAITAGGAVTAGTVSDKTGYSLSGTQTFNLTGNVTGNLSGSVGSVTGAVGSVTSPVTAGTVSDKTGYSLTQAFPTNFSSLAITAGGAVTAGTVSDKTGYSLSGTQSFNLTGNVTGNLSGSVGSVTGAVGSVTSPVTAGTVSDKTGYSLTQAFPTNFSNLAITASTGQVTVGSIANNAITAAAIATDAIGSDELAASAVTEIQSGLLLAANYTTPPTAAQNASQVRTELTTELGRIDTTISSRLASSGYTTPPTTGQIRTELTTELARLDVAVSTRLATAGYTTPPTTAQIATAVEAALLDDTDGQALLAAIQAAVQALFDQQADIPVSTLVSLIAAQITTDHGAGSYVAPNISALALEASVQAIKVKTDNLPSDPADQSDLVTLINTRASQSSVDTVQAGVNAIPTTPLLAANYTAPDNAGIAAIKAKTDNLPSDPADQSLVEAAIAALPSAATIADAVWDETLSDHLTAGSTGAKLNLASTLTVGDIPAGLSAQQVWEYTTRTLSVASGLTNTQEIKLNELYRKAGLDSAAPVTRTLNIATGNVAETFTGATINHVESQNATVVTSTREP